MHIGWRSSFGGRTWVEEQQVGASPSSLCRNSEVFCARFLAAVTPGGSRPIVSSFFSLE